MRQKEQPIIEIGDRQFVLLTVACSSTPCGLGIWVGNGVKSGQFRMKSMSSRNKSSMSLSCWKDPHLQKACRCLLKPKLSKSLR